MAIGTAIRRSLLLLVAVLAFAVASGRAHAQVCTVSATAVAFGAYNPLASAPTDITGTVSVSCQTVAAATASYSIQLSAGLGGSVNARRMSAGANMLSYQLYLDAARSVIWGDGTGGSGTVSASYALAALGNATRSYTVYGRIPARQNVVPGVFADTVIVVVVY